MTSKDILDTAKLIVKRQDFDRTLGLFLLNTILKDLVRDNRLSIFDTLTPTTYDVSGIISISTNNLKNIINIEWIDTDTTRKFLAKIKDYEYARTNYDFTEIGDPSYYVIYGNNIKLLPIPVDGTIEIYGEVYPTDLTDSALSYNTITNEIGNVLTYLVAGEYFDMIQEESRGKYWKEKGNILLTKYLSFLKGRQLQGIDPLFRDPFGNLSSEEDQEYTIGSL